MGVTNISSLTIIIVIRCRISSFIVKVEIKDMDGAVQKPLRPASDNEVLIKIYNPFGRFEEMKLIELQQRISDVRMYYNNNCTL